MLDIRRTAGALVLLAAVAGPAARATSAAPPPATPTSAGTADIAPTPVSERAASGWADDLPADRATALLLLAGIGLLGLRASRHRE